MTTTHAASGTRAGAGIGADVGLESRPQTARRPGEVIMRARGLEMSFGQTRALRGVDLDLLAGEVLAITGPSGSGKSTLLHVMAGVLVPDAGSVSYYGAGASWGGATDPAQDRAADTTADV